MELVLAQKRIGLLRPAVREQHLPDRTAVQRNPASDAGVANSGLSPFHLINIYAFLAIKNDQVRGLPRPFRQRFQMLAGDHPHIHPLKHELAFLEQL